jgi:hypothetical protein
MLMASRSSQELLDGHGRAPCLSVRQVPRGEVAMRQETLICYAVFVVAGRAGHIAVHLVLVGVAHPVVTLNGLR